MNTGLACSRLSVSGRRAESGREVSFSLSDPARRLPAFSIALTEGLEQANTVQILHIVLKSISNLLRYNKHLGNKTFVVLFS